MGVYNSIGRGNIQKSAVQGDSLLLLGKYRVQEQIGSGSFGCIYKCQNVHTRVHYAIKIEKKDKGEGHLQYEIHLYQIFQGISGFAQLHDFGNDNGKQFMILDLLGESLDDLMHQCGHQFSVATTLKIATQIVTRLEQIHRKGFVHRDIKATNFVVGRHRQRKEIYLIDFGLSKKYKDMRSGVHIARKGGKSLVGTARYASISSHEGFEQCRRDDLQSLGYVLLYFLRGKLPWQGLKLPKAEKYVEIGKMKRKLPVEAICSGVAQSAGVFVHYFDYVKALAFEEEPNYELIKKLFREELIRRKEESLPLDWEQ